MPNKSDQIIATAPTKNFTTDESGLYALAVIAKCEKAQELRIAIDSQNFEEAQPSKYVQKYQNPPSYNSNMLLGAAPINIFIVNLQQGEHTLSLISKGKAEIIDWHYSPINQDQAEFTFNLRSTYRNTQPWINFILLDTPLASISVTATTSWHGYDGDDLQLKIDGKIRQSFNNMKYRNWLWHALPNPNERTQTYNLTTHLNQGYHTLEFIATGKPTLHKVVLHFTNNASR